MKLTSRLETAAAGLRQELGEVKSRALILGRGIEKYIDLSGGRYIPYNKFNEFDGLLTDKGGIYAFPDGALIALEPELAAAVNDTRLAATGVRLLSLIGVRELVLVLLGFRLDGGIEERGCLFATDHINLSGENPLVGENLDSFGERFPDSTNVYDSGLMEELLESSRGGGFPVEKGIWVCTDDNRRVSDEIREVLIEQGAVIGSSEGVMEVLAAAHSGMSLAACIVTGLENSGSEILDKLVFGISER